MYCENLAPRRGPGGSLPVEWHKKLRSVSSPLWRATKTAMAEDNRTCYLTNACQRWAPQEISCWHLGLWQSSACLPQWKLSLSIRSSLDCDTNLGIAWDENQNHVETRKLMTYIFQDAGRLRTPSSGLLPKSFFETLQCWDPGGLNYFTWKSVSLSILFN